MTFLLGGLFLRLFLSQALLLFFLTRKDNLLVVPVFRFPVIGSVVIFSFGGESGFFFSFSLRFSLSTLLLLLSTLFHLFLLFAIVVNRTFRLDNFVEFICVNPRLG